MGELLVQQDEKDAVVGALREHGLDVTVPALGARSGGHRELCLYVEAEGSLTRLTTGLAAALEAQRAVRGGWQQPSHLAQPTLYGKPGIYAARLDATLGVVGVMQDGTYCATLGASRQAGYAQGRLSRVGSLGGRVQFSGTEHSAVLDGDIAVKETELKRVCDALRTGNIEIVAVHSPMAAAARRLLVLHFRGVGSAINLAWTLRRAFTSTPWCPRPPRARS